MCRTGIVAAMSVKVVEPVFESQTKTKLGSLEVEPGGQSMRSFIGDFLGPRAGQLPAQESGRWPKCSRQRILQKRARAQGAQRHPQKLARERAKKASLHNRKLRDCRIHLSDTKKDDRREESTLFITEGDSASGSITKSRDVNTQAVFSLKGKPLNSYGLTKKVVYENEEFNLIQAALNIEDGMDGLRYNKIVIATDADVDGMHIRLLLMTFFLQFFPDLVKNDHLYILQTPLFRVRNKKETIYCYSDEERQRAIAKLGKSAEITRFKGLGEISPDEFKHFIGPDIRLEPVMITKDAKVHDLLGFYMGKNTPSRQEFIIGNLKVEKDLVEETDRPGSSRRGAPFPFLGPGAQGGGYRDHHLRWTGRLVPLAAALFHGIPGIPARPQGLQAGLAAAALGTCRDHRRWPGVDGCRLVGHETGT
jgi:topoisomerase-4 subunit B